MKIHIEVQHMPMFIYPHEQIEPAIAKVPKIFSNFQVPVLDKSPDLHYIIG